MTVSTCKLGSASSTLNIHTGKVISQLPAVALRQSLNILSLLIMLPSSSSCKRCLWLESEEQLWRGKIKAHWKSFKRCWDNTARNIFLHEQAATYTFWNLFCIKPTTSKVQWKPLPVYIAEHNAVELASVSSILHCATVHQYIDTPQSLIPLNSHCFKEKENTELLGIMVGVLANVCK